MVGFAGMENLTAEILAIVETDLLLFTELLFNEFCVLIFKVGMLLL